ncbi:hypothetical protein PghCCS26_32960 [Paenibacillus glycanilyticus]|uniref:Uncharacterized protein n=1 Tax=Paenibacillus glycanilyticus TaxID=126569 RepID=A0ABQ6NM29_9BACL|nr:hypothetical protein PghCCS26_32960 [Paenibacillus glycanilyticus]
MYRPFFEENAVNTLSVDPKYAKAAGIIPQPDKELLIMTEVVTINGYTIRERSILTVEGAE